MNGASAACLTRWSERIRSAAAERRGLRLVGGGSKDFYGGALAGEVFATREYSGIVAYEPSELVISARGGTPLAEVEALLAEKGQMLGFEPPHFGPSATIGGAVAAGLSGPRRARVGALRDFVLGLTVIDGRGEILRFGGQVMKNVAGYDVARLFAGSLGTLGVIAEVSLKLSPLPVAEETLAFALPAAEALDRVNGWNAEPLPVSASAWVDGQLYLRLSAAPGAIAAARARLGGEKMSADAATAFWAGLREQDHAFFAGEAPLWRVALPPTAPLFGGEQLIEWGGGERWLRAEVAAGEALRRAAQEAGGHATLFRAGAGEKTLASVFTPANDALAAIQRRLKAAFDPAGIFNVGRMYSDF